MTQASAVHSASAIMPAARIAMMMPAERLTAECMAELDSGDPLSGVPFSSKRVSVCTAWEKVNKVGFPYGD